MSASAAAFDILQRSRVARPSPDDVRVARRRLAGVTLGAYLEHKQQAEHSKGGRSAAGGDDVLTLAAGTALGRALDALAARRVLSAPIVDVDNNNDFVGANQALPA